MTAAASPAAPPAHAKSTARSKTEYVVLKRSNSGTSMWEIASKSVTANNSDQAVRAHAETIAADQTTYDGAGTYIAVPARSWKPVTVKVDTKTILTLQDA